jgi:uncharacterized protein YigE (DUF2233 family)
MQVNSEKTCEAFMKRFAIFVLLVPAFEGSAGLGGSDANVSTPVRVEGGVSAPVSCRQQRIGGARYRICEIPVTEVGRLQLMARDTRGRPVRTIIRAHSIVQSRHERLLFATNAGLYHSPDSATGMLIADGGHVYSRLNELPGPPNPCDVANFYCPPNGVFFVAGGRAAILTTAEFAQRPSTMPRIEIATQSGPMLVHRDTLARRFNPGSTSRRVRNGVGVRADGTMVFAISDDEVNFHQFASAFQHELNCEDALFLDGAISRLYASTDTRLPAQIEDFAAVFVVSEPAPTGR